VHQDEIYSLELRGPVKRTNFRAIRPTNWQQITFFTGNDFTVVIFSSTYRLLMKIQFTIFLALITSLPLAAQGFSGGFKAGLNFNTFDGPVEDNGAGTEVLNRTTGFHIGATFAYGFTDLFGLKADLMYSQKGAEQKYEGRSFFYFYGDQGEIAIGGQRSSELDYVNSYIDIPVMAYYRVGPIELAAGASVGIMINSVGSGGATYTETIYGQNEEITFNYEGRFYTDGAQLASVLRTRDTPVGNTSVFLPEVIGAYYNHATDENLFRRFDFGLVADLNFYLNSGLYVGARYNIGLTDVTRVENDLAFQLGSSGERQFRDDKDTNQSIQASIGFRF